MQHNDLEPLAPNDLPNTEDDSEEIIMPDNLFTMKRSNERGAPDAKRQRVFTNSSGGHTYVDSVLMNDNFDLGDDSDSEEDEYDRNIRQLRESQLQESTSRGVRGAYILHDAKANKRQLTKGQKKLRKLIGQQNYTNDDLEEKLEHDDEGLVFVPAVTPKTALINSVLGPEEDRDDCYGCSRGVGLARVKQEKLNDLRGLILTLHGRTDVLKMCVLISEYFRTEIMEPSNANLRKGENKIEPWTPRGVYDHITRHMDAPDFVLSGMVRDLRDHLEILKNGQVYKVRAETARSRRKVHTSDIFVNKGGHKMMLETMNTIHKMLSSNPEKMMFHNSTFNIMKESPGVMSGKVSAEETTNLESIFDMKE